MDERLELARFLRDCRERLSPQQVGMAGGGPRRTAGLRREEVAVLAGLSVTHYTRMEQARGARPSAQVLSAVAAALRLSDDERTYVFQLARQVPRRPGPDRAPEVVPGSVLRLLDLLSDTPALVLHLRMDVLAWNPLAAALLRDFAEVLPEHRNMARLLFLDPVLRARFADHDAMARQSVAALRAALPALDGDHRLALLIGELSIASEAFRRHWNRREVRQKSRSAHRFAHPVAGAFTLDVETLRTPDGLLLVVYSAPPGTAGHTALSALTATPGTPGGAAGSR